MKEKLIEFFQSKKEIIVFVGLLSITFLAVILIASATIVPDDNDDVVVTPDPDLDNDDDDVVKPEEVTYDFILPFNGDKVVVRDFYNSETPGENEDAIIETNGMYYQSKGTSYANEDNSTFDVVNIYPGTVVNVTEDEVLGTTVTIDHGDEIYSVYSSLATTTISKGDKVETNKVIGTAGSSTYDIKAGVHVHIEVMSIVDDVKTYIDIEEIVGKKLDDIVSSIK